MPFVLLFLLSLTAHAETIVVTATRSEASANDLPYSVGVVNGEDFQAKGADPEKALQSIPGLSFTATGSPGHSRTVLIRGANAEHTLVLVDGMVVNDPLSPSRSFDFGQIPVDEIERIEVIKGPQSVLYGSDAMGGVVQIFTKKGTRPPRLRAEAGSYQTGKIAGSYLGFHAGYEKTKGFSVADEREGNSERDGNRVWRIGGNKEFPMGDDFTLRVQADYEDTLTDTDANGGRGNDSFGTYTSNQQLLFRTDGTYLVNDKLDLNTALSIVTHDRDDNTVTPAFYRAYLAKVEEVARFHLTGHQLTLGLEGFQESGKSSDLTDRRRFEGGAIYAQEQFGQRLHGTVGARLDLRSEQRAAPNARLGLGYWFVPDRWRVKGSLGTGYKAPSLYQTYSRYGTVGLRPEKSVGTDLGLEYTDADWESELTGYCNRFRDLIDFDAIRSKYFNLRRSETYGVEWSLARKLGHFTVSNALTTLHAIDTDTRLRLYRRPVVADTVSVDYRVGESYGAAASLRYVGRRDDVHPTLFTRQRMPAYAVVDANAFYRLSSEYKLFARGENLANRHYQEVSGYGVPELSAYTGVEASW